jgi:NAD(P)H-dependent FMN reductase
MAYLVSIIFGTGREGANSEKVANFVFESAKNFGFEINFIKVKDWLDKPYTGGMSEEKRNKLSEIFKNSQGFLIVSPEYNHSFPGELKLFLDEFYEEFHNKPVGICGVSVGNFGGIRMIQNLKPVLTALKLIPLFQEIYFCKVDNFENEKENYKEFLKNLFEELKFYMEKLRS